MFTTHNTPLVDIYSIIYFATRDKYTVPTHLSLYGHKMVKRGHGFSTMDKFCQSLQHITKKYFVLKMDEYCINMCTWQLKAVFGNTCAVCTIRCV